MRCTGYCSAAAFDTSKLFSVIQQKRHAHLYRDVVHTHLGDTDSPQGDIFCFSYGAVVFWGCSEEDETSFLHFLKEFEKEPISKIEIDEFSFCYGDNIKIEEDEITLHNKNVLTKLSLSHGIAQSIKLATFEEAIEKTVELSKNLPKELEKNGKIKLSRREIAKKMGEIFTKRTYINTHSEVLDTPEFFWNHPELEPFYRRSSHYLDLHKRVEILNRKLKILNELFEILQGELNHQHSSRLEWTIIILIVIEVLLDLTHFI
jgi:uncharacterized Rmd1/YagE family protein